MSSTVDHLFVTETCEIDQVPNEFTVEENFPGEYGFIKDYADGFLSSERLAEAHVESGARLFIHPIDSKGALYVCSKPSSFFDAQYQEDSQFPHSLLSQAEQVYTQRPEEVLVCMTYKFGPEDESRAHYLVSTTSAELTEIHAQATNQPQGFK